MNRTIKTAGTFTSILSATFLMLGCGSEDAVVDIIDSVETQYIAGISYLNMSSSTLTFYTKSTVYPNSVYDNQHRVVEVMPAEASQEVQHEWIDSANETQFAYEQSTSEDERTNATYDLVHNQDYWAIAWQQGQSHNLSLIAKTSANQANQYSVRVFTNADLNISLNQQSNAEPTTDAGQVTAAFSVAVCSDLEVGNHPINLCQSADFGHSYLVVLDNNTGAYLIVEE